MNKPGTKQINPDILNQIRHGETFEVSHHEFRHFMSLLDIKPEHKTVKFSVEIDEEKIITIRPTKPPEFYTAFKLFTAVLVSINLFKGVFSWKKKGVLKRFKKSKKVGK